MKTETYIGSLKIKTATIRKNKKSEPTRLDLFIVVIGWETRAAYVAKNAKISAEKFVGIRFKSRSDAIDKRKDQTASDVNKSLSGLNTCDCAPAADYFENCATLEKLIKGHYRTAQRPLRVGIDITCLPKMYIAFLVAFLFKCGIAAQLHVYYAEGVYAPLTDIDHPKVGLSFSAGEWDTVDVPYIEASVLGDHEKHLIMSVGAEIRQAKVYMSRFEPNRLAVLGVNNSEKRLDLSKVPDSKGMKELFDGIASGGGDAHFHEIDDVPGLLDRLAELVRSFGRGNITVLAVGCKPHTLAMTMVALSYPQIELVCRKPGVFANYDATPLGIMHHIQIVDRFEPHAYLSEG